MDGQKSASSRVGGAGGRLARGVAALATLLALLVAVPVALLAAGGDPLPRHVAGPAAILRALVTTDRSGRQVVTVALCVAWLAWLAFTVSMVTELSGRLRNRPSRRLPGLRTLQRLAAGLLTTVALMAGTAGTAAYAARPPVTVTAAATMADTSPTAASVDAVLVYRAATGDDLSGVARRFLGRADDYPRIAELNPGLAETGSAPARLRPGARLVLPAGARDRGAQANARGTLASLDLSSLGASHALVGLPGLDGSPGTDGHRDSGVQRAVDALLTLDQLVNPTTTGVALPTVPAPDLGGILDDSANANANAKVKVKTKVPPGQAKKNPPTPAPTTPPTGGPTTPVTTPPPTTPPATTPPVTTPTGTTTPAGTPSGGTSTPGTPATPTPAGTPTTRHPGSQPSTAPAPGGAAPTQTAPIRPVIIGNAIPVPHDLAAGATDEATPGSDALLALGGVAFGLIGGHLAVRRRRRRTTRGGTPALEGGTTRALGSRPAVAGTGPAAEFNRLDLALRDLSTLLGDRDGGELPDIIGSWLVDGAVHLVLTRPCPAPTPWIAAGTMWTLPAHAPVHSYFSGVTAPLPALVTVGGSDDRRVFVDLERLGVVTVGGDPQSATGLLRHVGAELCHGIWSDGVTIGIAGFTRQDTEQLVALGGGRVRDARSIPDALDVAVRWIADAHDRLHGLGSDDVLSARVASRPGEAAQLSPYALLLAGPDADDLQRLERLDEELAGRGRGQVAIAATTQAQMGRWPIRVDTEHQVTMDFLDARVPAVSLAGAELAALAGAPDRGHARPAEQDVLVGRHRAGRVSAA